MKVLIADDEREVLEIMARRVTAEGYEVVTAKDGKEAWQKIQKESPDIIVLDLIMPIMDGFEVLSRIKKDFSNIDVLIISAYGNVKVAVDAIKNQDYGKMVALRGNKIIPVSLEDAVQELKTVDLELYDIAKVFFGKTSTETLVDELY